LRLAAAFGSAHAIGAQRPWDVLYGVLSGKRQSQIKLPFDLPIRVFGNHYAAGFRKGFEPRGDVHAVAVDRPIAFLDHVAEIDADAEQHPVLLIKGLVGGGEHVLHLDRALDGFDHALELGENAVARGVDQAAGVRFDTVLENAPRLFERGNRRPLVIRHQPRIAYHIRG
jgi:hypothetical protein